jgi:hypothetical protein
LPPAQGPEIVIAELDKSAREKVRVALGHYNGTPIVSLWLWYRTPTGEFRPGKGGLSIGLRHLPALKEAVESALTKARELGRLPSQ